MVPPDFLLSIAAGALTTLSPCVFPVLPLVLGGAMQSRPMAPLAMGAGMVGAFTLIGVLVGTLGAGLDINAEHARTFGALMLLAFGVAMLLPKLDDVLKGALTPLANLANTAATGLEGGGLWRAAALGALLGLIWSPCSGPLLGAALTLVATQGKALEGAIRLGLFGVGAALPLMAVAYASRASLARTRDAVLRHGDRARRLTGVLMSVLGGIVLTGLDKVIEAHWTALLPEGWISFVTRY